MQEDWLWPKCLPWAYGMNLYQIQSNERQGLGHRGVEDPAEGHRNSSSGPPTLNPTFLPHHLVLTPSSHLRREALMTWDQTPGFLEIFCPCPF